MLIRGTPPGARPSARYRRHGTRPTISRTVSGVTRVYTLSLTSRAGPWSHMPMQAAQSSVKRPSADGLAEADAELALERVGDGVLAGQLAGDRAAQPHDELALGRGVEEGVERGDAVDLHGVDVEQVGDDLHRVRVDPW